MRFKIIPGLRSRPGLAVSAFLALAAAGGLAPGAALAAAPAWSPVAATGPTVIAPVQSEVQKVSVAAEGGTFTLTARRLAATGVGNVLAAPSEVTSLVTWTGAFAKGQAIEGGSIPTGTTITGVPSGKLTLSASLRENSQQITLFAYDTPETTAALAYDASAAEVQAALEALPVIGSGNVKVSGGPSGAGAQAPYAVSFTGGLADTNVAQLATNGASLVGGSVTALTTISGGAGWSRLALMVQNIGGLESSGTITYRATLSSGITAVAIPYSVPNTVTGEIGWSCGASTAVEILCTTTGTVPPSQALLPIDVVITAAPGVEAGTVHMEVSGGGAAAVGFGELPLTVSATPAKPGAQSFVAGAYDTNGNFDSRAGGHPYSASAAIFANTVLSPRGVIVPAGELRNITVELPPGFLGNPVAVPACPESTPTENCKLDTMVGITEPVLATFGTKGIPASVFNTQAPYGYPAKYRFVVAGVETLSVVGSLRSDEDFGVNAASPNTPQIEQVDGAFFTFWGEPASPSHDSARCFYGFVGKKENCAASDVPNTAFLTNATDCAEQAATPPVTRLNATLWQDPGEVFRTQVGIPAVTECDKLKFESNFTFQPNEAASADSPSGFTTNLTVPSEGLTDPEKLTTPEQKQVIVHLPNGVALNPSAAGGLGACSEAQIGLKGTGFAMPNPIRFDKNPNECPDSSKIGTIELKTALLEETLHGALYIAAQGNGNPFGSLFAVYLVIEDPRHGVYIKLPGEVEADKQTGQVTVTFEDLPQLPFESLKLIVKGGSRSPFATPTTCGTFTTTSVNTPWSAPESGPPFETENSFTVNSGANGSACASTPAQRPFSPVLSAGTASTSAGAFTPFVVKLTRNDGEQELSSIAVNAPPGFVGILTGLPFCPEVAIKTAEANSGTAEQQNPSCPAASQIGTLTAAVGVGSTPFDASGKAYFAGPYEGDPFSVVFVTPAVAGPFDLGDVVVRAGISVNPETAEISVKTDAIPQILDGVPLQIRSIEANINRPDFGLNPTSCEKSTITTTIQGGSGAVASPSNQFQVGGCSSLAFKPQFAVSTSAKTSRANGASLAVKLAFPSTAGEANIARVKVELPKQLPSRLTTLQKACTAAVFDANPAGCPAESVIGSARAVTPVLPVPLVGPVYFVSHGGEAFPSLIVVLQGYGVTVDLVGSTFISKAGITSSTFKTVPDVPVNTFELNLPQGKYSALAANGDLCTQKLAMPTEFVGQNGAQILQSTKIGVTGCPKAKKATLTRAQKLKAALKVCKKDKSKSKRAKCEKQAHKKYGPLKKAKKKKKSVK